ncbi:MAG TPA: GNAT family N-acetyltransferase [Actinomycetes bacterium]|nr:GNAT family N-acetyltransferase [Actinomycetes bacterium]
MSATTLLIRTALPAEYAAVGSLTADAYAPVLADGQDDPYRQVLLDARSRGEQAELLVAVDANQRLAGTVTLGRPGTAYAQIAREDELEVRMLAVAVGRERQGVGRQLMSEANNIAKREGFRSLVLSVIGSNTTALTFYERLGYQREPGRDWLPRADMELMLQVLTYQVT